MDSSPSSKTVTNGLFKKAGARDGLFSSIIVLLVLQRKWKEPVPFKNIYLSTWRRTRERWEVLIIFSSDFSVCLSAWSGKVSAAEKCSWQLSKDIVVIICPTGKRLASMIFFPFNLIYLKALKIIYQIGSIFNIS